MADRLYLSYWLSGFTPVSMLRHYGKMLDLFPFSKLRRADSVFRVYALEYSEPPLVELPVGSPVHVPGVLEAAKEFENADACYELETSWDLWRWEQDWRLAPSLVTLSCFGPEFVMETDENLRIDFGLDEQFLPGIGGAEGMRMVRSNIQSLLRLVHDLDNKLNVERRLLWSESGVNFAERLESSLRGFNS
jgi:hypothetical protein